MIVPSSPVVLPTDPTLLFANAGMNQFKEIFLGARQCDDRRVANTQKCIRVSGKHNDLEEVGFDTYHHTFFEMLGNWSFGDYGKEEAIGWAWELLTQVWAIPKDRLWVTVFREDDEAEQLWQRCTDVDPNKVLRFDEKDNFWEMGETGPCGPCSEIHVDLTTDGCTSDMVNAGNPEVVEIWNLVFIQFNRRSDGSLEDLPAKHVDTGMGFERVVAVLQHKKSNYDTDCFMPIIRTLEKLCGKDYGGEDAIAMRVIADHVRTLSMAIADGVLPSNDGRGYVLRRLLRRAVRFGHTLGFDGPFIGQLIPVVEASLGNVFPELRRNREAVLRSLKAEEENFASTLGRGLTLFEHVVADLKERDMPTFAGADAFKLYDTYGFPLDLTCLMAAEHKLTVDEDSFRELMEEQRSRARAARKDALFAEEKDLVSDLVHKGLRTHFDGYDQTQCETDLLAVLSGASKVDRVDEGDEAALLLDRTPFYAESGGQLGDEGIVHGPHGNFEVWDTKKVAEGIILHVGRVVQGHLSCGDQVTAEIDGSRRKSLARHHTATHLLNAGLRKLVDTRIRQKGSLVAPDHLRFDFNHYEPISRATLETIERQVNEWIMDNVAVDTYTMAFKDVPSTDVIAVFDEKYGDEVRVVRLGEYSKELCGGTHVNAVGEVGFFRIVNESSIASGVRRIEAVCGATAFEWTRREHELVHGLSQRFSAAPDELLQRVDALIEQNKLLEKERKQRTAMAAVDQAAGLMSNVRKVDRVDVVAEDVGELPMDSLRVMLDQLRESMKSGVVVLGSQHEGKACFVASVSEDLVKDGLHAGNLIGGVARVAKGGGGGQPHKAQAGGKDGSKVGDAIAQVDELIRAAQN